MTRFLAIFACAALLAGAAPQAQARAFQISWPGGVFLDERDGYLQVRITENGSTLKFEARGEFDLADDESDVARIVSGGTITIEERRHGRTKRLYVVRGLSDGGLEREFEAEGHVREMGDADKAWLRESLQTVLGHTTFAVETHVKRLLAQGGPAKALEAIAAMPSDHVQGEHYRELLAQQGGDPETCAGVAEHASRSIGSDHEMAEVFVAVMERASGDRRVALACARGTEKIGSDHERRVALTAILDASHPDPEVAQCIAQSAGGIGSDHERAEVLLALLRQGPLAAQAAPSFFEATRGLGSDHEAANVLGAVLEQSDVEQEILLEVIEGTNRIGSDHEKGRVLIDLAGSQKVEGRVREAYLDAARKLGSDHRREEVLAAVGEGRDARHH
jgi:hypothetical protein